jgi:hypothetical protein
MEGNVNAATNQTSLLEDWLPDPTDMTTPILPAFN